MSNFKKYIVNKFINSQVSVQIAETSTHYEVECEVKQRRKTLSRFEKTHPERAFKKALDSYNLVVQKCYATYVQTDAKSPVASPLKEYQTETIEEFLARGGRVQTFKPLNITLVKNHASCIIRSLARAA